MYLTYSIKFQEIRVIWLKNYGSCTLQAKIVNLISFRVSSNQGGQTTLMSYLVHLLLRRMREFNPRKIMHSLHQICIYQEDSGHKYKKAVTARKTLMFLEAGKVLMCDNLFFHVWEETCLRNLFCLKGFFVLWSSW